MRGVEAQSVRLWVRYFRLWSHCRILLSTWRERLGCYPVSLRFPKGPLVYVTDIFLDTTTPSGRSRSSATRIHQLHEEWNIDSISWTCQTVDLRDFTLCAAHHFSDPAVTGDRKSTRLNSSHSGESRMPSSA